LRGAKLDGANLQFAELPCADLRDTSLAGANLIEADLMCARLRGVDMSKATLRGAYLNGADLGAAILTGTDFSYASLLGAHLEGARIDQNTNFYEAKADPGDFRGVDTAVLKRENLPAALWAE
jgi:uncharacterized protein YjbI with pentapeptide repeats